MKTKLLLLACAVALGIFFYPRGNSEQIMESKPLEWLSNVKESLPLPRTLKGEPKAEDISSLSLEQTEREIKSTEEKITDTKTIEELNQDKATSEKRDEIELLMRRRNLLTDHLLDLKLKALTNHADTVLGVQRQIIQNSIKEMENE